MSIYTISDLHLPLGINKPMDIFGKKWANYVERLKENWQSIVKENDTVILGGDFSWAMYLEEAFRDFEFLEELNGRKILLKGNHDYWWTTANKLNTFIKENAFKSISFLQNNCFFLDDIAICGTRGWAIEGVSAPENKKIYDREILRLRLSLDEAKKQNVEEILVFTHFPPVTKQALGTTFHNTLKEYGVKRCIYGHLHGISHENAFTGEYDGIKYILASADYLEFNPIKLTED